MIQAQLKLRPTKHQESEMARYLFHLQAVYNWAIRKIEINANDNIYFSRFEFLLLLTGHSVRLGIPGHVLQGVLGVAFDAWRRCFKKLAHKPRLKGRRNKLNSIPFPDPLRTPKGNRVTLLGLGPLRFHKQDIPAGKIKCSRIVKRASGWYLCLFIDAEREPIEREAAGEIGIDPGFSNLLTTSEGEVIEHPRELEASAERLAQAQRGNDLKLVVRLQERISNQRKDRNHKLSRRLVAENIKIYFSKDNTKGIAGRFGKSVLSSSHSQLRQMLAYKSRAGGTEYAEVYSRFSTKTCSDCGAQSGPSGFTGLSVRQWRCTECGTLHDRDVNAAINTLIAGAGIAHEGCQVAASGTARCSADFKLPPSPEKTISTPVTPTTRYAGSEHSWTDGDTRQKLPHSSGQANAEALAKNRRDKSAGSGTAGVETYPTFCFAGLDEEEIETLMAEVEADQGRWA